MSYQVLARKWRPRTFSEMAGQGHVLTTLINALDSQRLHHAYLFTGTRGVGKTTIARILARCLNCEKGVTSQPCGECSACREISEGRFIDLIEVDAASRTKVEDTRELLDNVQYAPSRGRYKVYLIDEVHMLSTHSFNALLKTLEEPPPHVKFLLATTDPQKLPITVLSRCLQFNLKNLSPERLVEHTRHILDQEGITYEEPALWQLGRAAQGSVRDCLTLLDQAISYCDGTVTDAGVREFLGNIDRSVISALVDALVAQDAAALLAQVAQVAEHSPDFAVILQELLSWLHRVALAQVVPEGIDNSQGDRAQILAHAVALPAEVVQLYYQIALKGREDLPFAPDPRSGLEMSLLRMLAFTPAGIPALPVATLGSSTSPAGQKKKPLAEGGGPASPAVVRQGAETAALLQEAATAPLVTGPSSVAAKSSGREAPPAEVSAARSSEGAVPARQASASRASSSSTATATAIPASAVSMSAAAISEVAIPTTSVPATSIPAASTPPVSVPAAVNQAPARAASARSESAVAAAGSSAQAAERIALADLRPEHWIGLFAQLDLGGVVRSIASNCVLAEVNGKRLTLLLEESQATLFNDEHRRRIEAALAGYFAVPVELQIRLGKVTGETPAAWRIRDETERRQAAIASFSEDPVIRAIVERFGGEIQTNTITTTTGSP
jgi:DNA polymerase III subunit gamma/tau